MKESSVDLWEEGAWKELVCGFSLWRKRVHVGNSRGSSCIQHSSSQADTIATSGSVEISGLLPTQLLEHSQCGNTAVTSM